MLMIGKGRPGKIIGFKLLDAEHDGRISTLRSMTKENPLLKKVIGDLMTRKSFEEFANGTIQWKQKFADVKNRGRTEKERLRAAHAFRAMDDLSKILNEIKKRKDMEKQLREIRKGLITR